MRPRRRKSGDEILAKDHNAIVRVLRGLGLATGRLHGTKGALGSSTYSPIIKQLDGTIYIPEPGDDRTDYTDCRYYVRVSYCNNDSPDDEEDIISFYSPVIADDETDPKIITATNIAELLTDTHLLAKDAPVIVYWTWDIQNPKIKHYFISDSSYNAVNLGKPVGWYVFGATIALDPCDSEGTDNGLANVTVQAGWTLPANTNIPVSAIIPYQLAADNKHYVLGSPKEVITNIRYDTGTHKIQKKVRYDFGWFCSTESSAWVDVTTAVNCTGV